MSIPHSIKRDVHRRRLLSKQVVTQFVHKAICHDLNFEISNPDEFAFKERARILHHSPSNSVQTRVRNRCIISGRSKGIYRFCRLSRIRMRELASRGLLNGIYKASW